MSLPPLPEQPNQVSLEILSAFYRHYYSNNMAELTVLSRQVPEEAQKREWDLLSSLIRVGMAHDAETREAALVEAWNDMVLCAYTAQGLLWQRIGIELKPHLGSAFTKAHHWDGNYGCIKPQYTDLHKRVVKSNAGAIEEHNAWKRDLSLATGKALSQGKQWPDKKPWLRGAFLADIQAALDEGIIVLAQVDLSRMANYQVGWFLLDEMMYILGGGVVAYLLIEIHRLFNSPA